MEVVFLHVTGSFIVYVSYVLHVVGVHFDRSCGMIWSEVERFLFLSGYVAKCYEINQLTLVKYEYLRRLWPRNTKMYVMTVTEAAILQEFLLWT